jgi:hypothetical protein
VRFADLPYLTETLRGAGISSLARFATSFWDIHRFPEGVIRTAVIRFNRFYFRLHLPASLAIGNAILGEKVPAAG